MASAISHRPARRLARGPPWAGPAVSTGRTGRPQIAPGRLQTLADAPRSGSMTVVDKINHFCNTSSIMIDHHRSALEVEGEVTAPEMAGSQPLAC